MSNAATDINPKNQPYVRRVNAVNQPFGDSVLTTFSARYPPSLRAMGPNRKERRWESRSAARPKNQKVAKIRREKRYTMVPGDHTGPRKRTFWKWLGEALYDLAWLLATPIRNLNSRPKSKRGLRG